jgi:surface antigen
VLIRRFSLPATTLVVFAILASLLVGAPRAEATSTVLCKGFSTCTNAGFSNFGYSSNYTKMWWRMFAGHNCTNYVSYRMVSRGMSPTRPWSGSGDARNWGVVFASKTNQTPMVGSVAWWSTNHVAYVQRIIDANTIVISEDHWGGDFDWRKIVRSGGGWPTGFIHLNDEAMRATSAPKIIGTAKVDAPLAATPGTWNRAGATYSYQWLANGVAVPNATLPTYAPKAQQLAATFSVKVTAARAGYRSSSSVSAATAATAPGTMTVTGVPKITGLAKVGAVLTVSGGAWTPAASSSTIAWLADGVVIPGATQPIFKLGAAQLNRKITVVVTGRRAGYLDAPATSVATAPVGPEKLSLTREPTLAGTPHLGHPVAVTPGVVGPAGVVTTYEWMRDGAAIPGANAASYTPTADDLGTRLSVRVTYSKPGYTSIVRTLALAAPVRTYARILVASQDHRQVTVTVRALGVDPVRGQVTLINAHGDRRTLTLDHGQVTFHPDWIYAGERTYTVIYEGSFKVEARTVTKTLVVQ